MMKRPGLHPYRRTQVLTANPAELMLLLYNAAICFCEQAKTCMGESRFEESHALLVRTENVIMELSAGLRRDVYPELVDNLSRLFEFVFYRLFEANISGNPRCIQEAINVLVVLRDAWVQAADKAAKEARGTTAQDAATSVELSA